VRIDERAYYHQLLQNMDVEESKVFIYPRMFSIHDMSTDAGLPSDSAEDDGPTAGELKGRRNPTQKYEYNYFLYFDNKEVYQEIR
jgi:hypothetical protein